MIGDAGAEANGPADVGAARLLEAIMQHREDAQRPYALSVSVGSALFDRNVHTSLRELVEAADRAMYEAKRARRVAEA